MGNPVSAYLQLESKGIKLATNSHFQIPHLNPMIFQIPHLNPMIFQIPHLNPMIFQYFDLRYLKYLGSSMFVFSLNCLTGAKELICTDYLLLNFSYIIKGLGHEVAKIIVIRIKVLWRVISFVFYPKFCDIFMLSCNFSTFQSFYKQGFISFVDKFCAWMFLVWRNSILTLYLR